jgi:lipocalin
MSHKINLLSVSVFDAKNHENYLVTWYEIPSYDRKFLVKLYT